MFSRLAVTAIVTLCLAASTACTPQPELQISEAKIRALIPGRDTTAGYFVLRNNSASAVTLSGASSPNARAIEMHKTYIKEDRVGMQRVPEITLEPGEQIEFAPGGLHLMIFGVEQIVEPFPITLLFDAGKQVTASFSKLSN